MHVYIYIYGPMMISYLIIEPFHTRNCLFRRPCSHLVMSLNNAGRALVPRHRFVYKKAANKLKKYPLVPGIPGGVYS